MTQLRDRRALLTGASQGIGPFIASALAGTIGSCTPQQVAAAVVRAVEHDLPEIIVNSRPVKPLLALAALSPRLAGWLMRRLGVVDFQRRKVGR